MMSAMNGSLRSWARHAGQVCRFLANTMLLCVLLAPGASIGETDSFQTDAVREAPTSLPGLDREARLEQALSDYAAGLREADRDERLARFGRAERAFASLIEDGVETAPLWTNLGNAALQAGHVGRAVLAYHRALRLDPDAHGARQNLAHVRGQLPSWVPRPIDPDGSGSGLDPRRVPEATRRSAAGIAFALAALSTLLFVRRGESAWRALAGLLMGVWLLLMVTLLIQDDSSTSQLAVVTAEEVEARSADSSLAALALPDPLPAGSEVRRLELRGEWARIRLANGRDVWVRASSVTPVSP